MRFVLTSILLVMWHLEFGVIAVCAQQPSLGGAPSLLSTPNIADAKPITVENVPIRADELTRQLGITYRKFIISLPKSVTARLWWETIENGKINTSSDREAIRVETPATRFLVTYFVRDVERFNNSPSHSEPKDFTTWAEIRALKPDGEPMMGSSIGDSVIQKFVVPQTKNSGESVSYGDAPDRVWSWDPTGSGNLSTGPSSLIGENIELFFYRQTRDDKEPATYVRHLMLRFEAAP